MAADGRSQPCGREAEHSVGFLKFASLPSILQTVGTAPLSHFTASARGRKISQTLNELCTFEIPGTDAQAKE